MKKNKYSIVWVSAPKGKSCERLARKIIQAKLAACVSIIPAVKSVYRWKGSIESTQESLLMIKTSGQMFERLRAFVTEHHPYEVPEIIAIPFNQGHKPYLDWIEGALK